MGAARAPSVTARETEHHGHQVARLHSVQILACAPPSAARRLSWTSGQNLEAVWIERRTSGIRLTR